MLLRQPAQRVAEEDSLDTPVDHDPPSHAHVGYARVQVKRGRLRAAASAVRAGLMELLNG
jgi:hypothetical protein